MTKINYLGKHRLYKLLQAGLDDARLLPCPYPCEDFDYFVLPESGYEHLSLNGYSYHTIAYGCNYVAVYYDPDDFLIDTVAVFMRGCSHYHLDSGYLEMGEYIDFPPEGERGNDSFRSEYGMPETGGIPLGGIATPTDTPLGGIAAPTDTPFGGIATPTDTSLGGIATPTDTPFDGIATPTDAETGAADVMKGGKD